MSLIYLLYGPEWTQWQRAVAHKNPMVLFVVRFFKSKVYRKSFSRQGLTLVEIMIAMVVFGFLSLAITSSVIQSHQISQNNILRNTAYTAAQGYLEQIRSMPLPDLLAAMDDPEGSALPTVSLPIQAQGTQEVADPLYLDGPDKVLDGRSNGSNHRRILIDLQERENQDPREVYMDVWFDVEIESLGASSKSHAIEIYFETDLRGSVARKVTGSVRGVRADVNRVVRNQ